MQSNSHRAPGTVARVTLMGLAMAGFLAVAIPVVAEEMGWNNDQWGDSAVSVADLPNNVVEQVVQPEDGGSFENVPFSSPAVATVPMNGVSLPPELVPMLTSASDAPETGWAWGQDCANGQCAVSMALPVPPRNSSGACQCDLWSVTDNQCGMNAEPKCTGKFSCGCVAQPLPTRICSCNDGLGCTVDACDAVTGECSHQGKCDSGKTCTTQGCCVFEAGSPCLSPSNRCGMFSYGTVRCDGSCSALSPANTLCGRDGWSTGCQLDEDCEDKDPCTTDVCVRNPDSISPYAHCENVIMPTCGSGVCPPPGEQKCSQSDFVFPGSCPALTVCDTCYTSTGSSCLAITRLAIPGCVDNASGNPDMGEPCACDDGYVRQGNTCIPRS